MTSILELRRNESAAIAPPRRRWALRVALPLGVLLAAGGLLAWASRDVFRRPLEVRVAPVVAKEASGGGGATENEPVGRRVVAQAAGWVEPAPFAVVVPALAEGVVEEVFALEGQRVEAGQALARLMMRDAELDRDRARGAMQIASAELARAHAAAAAASARVEGAEAELDRKRSLVEVGAASTAEIARLERNVEALEQDRIAAEAAVRVAEAAERSAALEVIAAELRLDRMEIRAPISGVVLSRSVEPGTRIAMAGAGPGEAHDAGVFRLYDPAKLQVRVDVPLADAGKVMGGMAAEVTTEAMPDRVFSGRVSRLVHEADIQRNTLQVKVAIDAPDSGLKPEMLVRVRFVAEGRGGAGTQTAGGSTNVRLLAPETALLARSGDRAEVWVVDLASRGGATASKREVALGGAAGGLVEVQSGLREGDRLIIGAPQGLEEGRRVRIAGEVER